MREVAEHMTRQAPVPDYLRSTISQRAFDQARAEAGHPNLPTARAIGMRLGDGLAGQGSLSWSKVLELACSGEYDLERWQIRNQAAPQNSYLSARHLYFALRLAATPRGQNSILPSEYAATRAQLIPDDRRRARREGRRPLLEELMPTVGQIERITRHVKPGASLDGGDVEAVVVGGAGEVDDDGVDGDVDRLRGDRDHRASGGGDVDDIHIDDDHDRDEDRDGDRGEDFPAAATADTGGEWDRALELAGLASRAELTAARQAKATPRGVPAALAIHHFLETHGVDAAWPSAANIKHFARLAGTALAAIEGEWIEHLRAGGRFATARAFPLPEDYR